MNTASPQSGEPWRKRRRQSNASALTLRGSEAASSPQEHGHMRPSLVQGSASFVGSGSGIHFVRTVQSAFASSRRDSQCCETVSGEIIPGEDDQLHERIGSPPESLWHLDEVFDYTTNGEVDPNPITFEDLIKWSEAYWKNWHPPFPFLHAPTVLGLFERTALSGIERLKTVELMIVRAVLSISVADRRQMPMDNQRPIPSNLVFNTVNGAMSCLTSILLQPSTLEGLQAIVAVQVFLVSMLRLNTASRIGGLITRIAFHLGLHRCPSKYKHFSIPEADIRRRVFWAIYGLERFLCQSLGLPLDIKDDDIDVCYPDKEFHKESRRPPTEISTVVQNTPEPGLLLLPAFLARHGYIKGLILELRNKAIVHRSTDQVEVAYVDSEISKWWNEAQDLLDPHYVGLDNDIETETHTENNLSDSHKLMLVVQKHESTILLNRPVITSAEDSSLFAAAMQKCIGASKQIVSKVHEHLQKGMSEVVSRDGRIRSPLFWPGFTWCIWMSGLILLYAASEGHYPIKIAQREAERCIRILENLALRGNFWPLQISRALKDLQKALVGTSTRSIVDKPTIAQSPNTSSILITSKQRQVQHHNEETIDSRSQAIGEPWASPSLTNPIFRTADVGDNHLASQDTQSGGYSIPTTSISPGCQDTSFLPEETNNWQQIWPTDFGYGLSGPADLTGDQFEGVADIFQLMDASYQFSEQMC